MKTFLALTYDLFPDWANYVFTDGLGSATKAFLFGFIFASGIRIVRAALKWFKRASTEKFD